MSSSSVSMLRLVVDSGNSRIKWGMHDGSEWLERGVLPHAEGALLKQQWECMAPPDCIVVSHVAMAAARHGLSAALAVWETEPRWISAATYQCGVRNYYADPAQLGSDRWAALIAAWNLQRQGCLVVDAGTVLTVDALSDTGEFLGGIIIPGMEMMRGALASQAASPAFTEALEGTFRDYPDSTADAVYSGAEHAHAGAVERMASLLAETLGHAPDCLVCGGGAPRLQSRLGLTVTVVEDLVLQGLLLIAEEDAEDDSPGRP